MLRACLLVIAAVTFVRADFEAPSYTVSLDEDPYTRWKPVADDLIAKHGYEDSWGRLHAFLEDHLT